MLKPFPEMYCRYCNTSNPFVYLAPISPDKHGRVFVVCINCAEKKRWIDKNGNIAPNINL